MPRRFVIRFALLVLAQALSGQGAPTEWPDADGTRFRGEPAGLLGSLALFRTAEPLLKRVPLRALSAEDCHRFHLALSARPARAARWTDARGLATRELPGAVQKLEHQYRRLIPADLGGVPEPELLIVLYGTHGDSTSWSMVNNLVPTHLRIGRIYPGLTGTVFYGQWHSATEHNRIATEAWTPWLTTDFPRQRGMDALTRHAPKDGALMTVLTRDGDLLLAARPENLTTIRRFIDDLTDLLWAANPLNARASADLAHYGRTVRPLEFARGSTGPLLVRNPLRADGLRQRGVNRVEAHLEIDAEGKVAAVTLLPGSVLPAALSAPLADALKRSAVFLPAINQGVPVAATCDYLMAVPPPDAVAEADAVWLDRSVRGEVPLLDWKILKTLPVSQQEFGEIAGVGPDGKVIMQALEVSKARVSRASQLSAFHTDWFAEAGADSVVPVAGQTQVVDGHTLVWRSLTSRNGYVDLQEGESPPREYCVGYAWTEIEVSAPTSAWLGIGSDDGLKIWHNGVLVNDRWVRRLSRIDDDIVPLQLKAGKNQLLVKIQNASGGWSFVNRLRYRDR